MKRLAETARWLAARRPSAAAALEWGSLAGIGVGCGMIYPPLGVLVPSAIVFAVLLAGKLRN